jgi:hypothetical protein
MAGTLLFDEKSTIVLLFFGMDCWIMDIGILYSRAVIQRTTDVSHAFLEHGSAEKIAV